VKEVGAEEVPFQVHYQATDLRALLQFTMHHPEKNVHSMLACVQKHMGNTSPALVAEVWPIIQSYLQTQYELGSPLHDRWSCVLLPCSAFMGSLPQVTS